MTRAQQQEESDRESEEGKHPLVLPVRHPIFLRGEPQLPQSLSMKLRYS